MANESLCGGDKIMWRILIVVVLLAVSSLACGGDEYKGSIGDALGISGTILELNSPKPKKPTPTPKRVIRDDFSGLENDIIRTPD